MNLQSQNGLAEIPFLEKFFNFTVGVSELFMLQECQVVSKTNGGFSDDIASSMHHAGVVVATDAGIPPPQAVTSWQFTWHVLLAVSVQATGLRDV